MLYDWIKTGWGDSMSPLFSPNESFVMDLGKYPSSTTQPLDAATEAIRDIAIKYPGPYTLMCSGGVDSQVMLYSWHKSGIPFKVVSIKYIHDGVWYNEHDLSSLIDFAGIHKIDIEFKTFDVMNFLDEEFMEYAFKYQCTSPQICTYMKMSELITEGTLLFSGDIMVYRQLPLNYTIYGLKRYADISNRAIIPFFFLYSPNMLFSFNEKSLEDSYIVSYLHGEPNQVRGHTDFTYIAKCRVYSDSGFPILPQVSKFSGFENIKDYYDTCTSISFNERIRFSNKPSKRNFDIIYRYRLHEMIPYEDIIRYILK